MNSYLLCMREIAMQAAYKSAHWIDADGNPAGGCTYGPGFAISWQNGPLGRGDERQEPNGAFVENIVLAAIGRIEFYQDSKFACQENADALEHLKLALGRLQDRTARREAAATEGTHAGS